MWHWHAIYTIHVYIQDTPLEWPCLQTKIRNYRNDRSKMNQNTMDLYYAHTWLRYGLQPGHIIGLPPAPQVDNWTPRHGQSCNCFAGNDSSTRTCIATSCPRQPTDVIYSDAAYSFWGMLGYPIQWITCHISSGRCAIRRFGQHRIGSMAFIIQNLLPYDLSSIHT